MTVWISTGWPTSRRSFSSTANTGASTPCAKSTTNTIWRPITASIPTGSTSSRITPRSMRARPRSTRRSSSGSAPGISRSRRIITTYGARSMSTSISTTSSPRSIMPTSTGRPGTSNTGAPGATAAAGAGSFSTPTWASGPTARANMTATPWPMSPSRSRPTMPIRSGPRC